MDINLTSLIAVFLSSALTAMGLGGGSLLLLWLLSFTTLSQAEAQSLNLFLFLPCAIFSAFLHHKNSLLQISLLKKSLLSGLCGSILGAVLCTWFPTTLLKKCFAVFLLYTSGREFYSLWSERKEKQLPNA